MDNTFQIVSLTEGLSTEPNKLLDITDENMKNYKSYGVWTLLGRKNKQSWKCLQVGQSNNIGSEILSDVECLSGKRKIVQGRKYINQFGNVVEGYTYDVFLTTREQIYEKIGQEYNKFIFVCICCGEDYKDNKKDIEKYVAWKLRALFWRNGGAFKNEKANVQEPEDIEQFDLTIKKDIDKMVKWYKKQLN